MTLYWLTDLLVRNIPAKTRRGEVPWDHQMDEELSDISSIEQIDDGVIRNKWMNVMFVDFVFHFAVHVSKNKKYVMNRLVDESVTIFDVLSASDIAWAVTCYCILRNSWQIFSWWNRFTPPIYFYLVGIIKTHRVKKTKWKFHQEHMKKIKD